MTTTKRKKDRKKEEPVHTYTLEHCKCLDSRGVRHGQGRWRGVMRAVHGLALGVWEASGQVSGQGGAFWVFGRGGGLNGKGVKNLGYTSGKQVGGT